MTLRCTAYLNQPISREKLWTYLEHLAKAHGKRLPKEISLRNSCSELSQQKAYGEVEFLANSVETSYGEEPV